MLALIILAVAFVTAVTVTYFLNRPYWGDAMVVTVVICVIIEGFAVFPFIGFTGGLLPEYSVGVRDGYVTKLSHSGVVFKTWEGQLQVGTGNMAALQEPFRYSVPDEKLRAALDQNARSGDRVRVHYREYLVPNFREGGSSYIVTDVEVLPKTPIGAT